MVAWLVFEWCLLGLCLDGKVVCASLVGVLLPYVGWFGCSKVISWLVYGWFAGCSQWQAYNRAYHHAAPCSIASAAVFAKPNCNNTTKKQPVEISVWLACRVVVNICVG